MTTLPSKLISSGAAARYLKPSWIQQGKVSANAFDLRLNRTPPEDFVSFVLIDKGNDKNSLQQVYSHLTKRVILKTTGAICVIPIEDALDIVNQNQLVIWFSDHGIPHIGLHFSKDIPPQEVLEAKSMLAWFAGKKLVSVGSLENKSDEFSLPP